MEKYDEEKGSQWKITAYYVGKDGPEGEAPSAYFSTKPDLKKIAIELVRQGFNTFELEETHTLIERFTLGQEKSALE